MRLVGFTLLSSGVLFLLAGCGGGEARGEEPIALETVEYRDGEVVCEGVLARPRAAGRGPAVLVFHAWKGIGDHERESARRLAEAGYTALCADIYGKGVRPATNAEAGREAGKYKGDPPLLTRRAVAALALLAGDAGVDAERIGAIGYCFGGTTALELARSGAAVKATVSFHGGLAAGEGAGPGSIRGAVLALHGADDPFVPAAEVSAFEAEMRSAGIDWTLVAYGGAVHSFTDPAAGDDPSRGAAYHARSARRSWDAALSFLRETLVAP